MSIARSLAVAAALAGAPSALAQSFPAPVSAGQPVQTMPRPTPDADALAAAMRRLGANPRDLPALIEAGELSLRLGDVNAAAALFRRAEMVDPMNGRVKAGMARILVTQERPGEALRYFDQATGYGLDPRTFAGDRALAYDLIGEQERAQRDYRVALKDGRNDEIERRYALSLGISGKREQALAEIDAQVRRNDRSAWRTRAFILAMTGDVPGAEKIAATMMPPGMGGALAPFFGRLPALTPIDRAFAVHFGELRASPQRLADARMAPPLPVLAPEAPPPVQLAAAAAAPSGRVDQRRERQRARDEARRQRALAREQQRGRRDRRSEAPPVAVASVPADPAAGLQPPRYGGGVTYAPQRAVVQALPPRAPAPMPAPPPVFARTDTPAPQAVPPVNRVAPLGNTVATVATAPAPGLPIPPAPSARPAPAVPPTAQASAGSPSPQPGFSSLTATPAPASVAVAPNTPASGVPPVAVAPAQLVAHATTPPPVTVAAAASPPPNTPVATVASASGSAPVTSTPAATTSAPVVAAVPVAPPLSEDTILARIMAGISIPAEELGVEPPRPRPAAPAPVATAATSEGTAPAEAAPRAAEAGRAAQQARPQEAVRKPVQVAAKAPAPPTDPKPTRGSKAEATAAKTGTAKNDRTKTDVAKADKEAPVDPKKAAADRKAVAAKKAADAKKVADEKKAANEAKLAKADPPRIWVQVAGGANESDLPKAWGSAKAKAAALKGKTAYSTPLRATNRVVTGPFKTDAEARAFINTLAKQGVSAFPFTSEKGQKMKKLTDQ
jgi:tetratricopeptide (TPR) repeat protein